MKIPLSHQYTQEYQNRMTVIVTKLCMIPLSETKLWCSGGPSKGWWISGVREGDCFLPESRGIRFWWKAIEVAEQWLQAEGQK